MAFPLTHSESISPRGRRQAWLDISRLLSITCLVLLAALLGGCLTFVFMADCQMPSEVQGLHSVTIPDFLLENKTSSALETVVPSSTQTVVERTAPECPELNDEEIERRLLSKAEQQYKVNMAKRKAYLGSLQPTKVDSMQKWLGVFVPPFQCPGLQRVGNYGDGGKWICNMKSLFKNDPPVIISVGSFGQYGFEQDARNVLGADIYTFDPFLTPGLSRKMHSLPFLTFFDVGLSGEADVAKYEEIAPGKVFATWPQLQRMTNESFIDILKIDCEKCEFEVVKDLVALYGENRRPPIGQICVEVHELTKDRLQSFYYPLENLGYRLFSGEVNPKAFNRIHEFSFIHETLLLSPDQQSS